MGPPGGAPPLPALEGFDSDLETYVLSEFKQRKRRAKKNRYVIKEEYFSGFDSMMNHGEFDKLPYAKDDSGKDVIVESIVEESERKAVIEENRRILMNEEVTATDDDEVKMSDLPS